MLQQRKLLSSSFRYRCLFGSLCQLNVKTNKKLSCRRGTARRSAPVEIMSTVTQMYEKSHLKSLEGHRKWPYISDMYLAPFPRYYHFYSVRDCLSPGVLNVLRKVIPNDICCFRAMALSPLRVVVNRPVFTIYICCSDMYRGITLTPVISKLFEAILRVIYDNSLYSDPLQFGFKKNTSCSRALFGFTEAVKYYRRRGNKEFCAFLDASKAFDKVFTARAMLALQALY